MIKDSSRLNLVWKRILIGFYNFEYVIIGKFPHTFVNKIKNNTLYSIDQMSIN